MALLRAGHFVYSLWMLCVHGQWVNFIVHGHSHIDAHFNIEFMDIEVRSIFGDVFISSTQFSLAMCRFDRQQLMNIRSIDCKQTQDYQILYFVWNMLLSLQIKAIQSFWGWNFTSIERWARWYFFHATYMNSLVWAT